MSQSFRQEHPVLDKLISIEAFLIQTIAYMLLWLYDDYLASILSLILGGIALSLFLVSKLIEWVDQSRVPKVYYRLMFMCFLAPLIAGIIGLLLSGNLTWMDK